MPGPDFSQHLPSWLLRGLKQAGPAVIRDVALWYTDSLLQWQREKTELLKKVAASEERVADTERRVTETERRVTKTKDEVIVTQNKLVPREMTIADSRVEVERLLKRLGLQTTLWLQKTGQFHMRGLLEYLSDDLYEALPLPTRPPKRRVTRRDQFEAVLTDPAYAPLLTDLAKLCPGSTHVISGRLTQIYGQLSKHIHSRYTPAEWQASGDHLRIVEGALARWSDGRLLEAICTHLGIAYEVTKHEGQASFFQESQWSFSYFLGSSSISSCKETELRGRQHFL